jgi:hypothetical protein
MASILISAIQPFLNLFSSTYPNGVSGSIVSDAVKGNTNVQIINSVGETIINYALTVSPSSGFANGEFTMKVYNVGVIYEVDYGNYTEILQLFNEFSVDIYYVNSNPVVDDTTPPVITPLSGTTITIQEDTFASSTVFINTYFSVSDPESGVDSVYLNPTIDFQMPRATGTVQVIAINGDGYSSSLSFTLTITTRDTTIPTITASTTSLNFFRSSYPIGLTTGNLANAMVGVTFIYDDSGVVTREFTPNITNWNPTVFPAQRVYNIRARDNAGNYSANTISMTVNYIDDVTPPPDNIPPTITLDVTNFIYYKADYPNGVTASKIQTDVLAEVTATDNIPNNIAEIQFTPTIQSMTSFGAQQYQVSALDTSNNRSEFLTFNVSYIEEFPDTIAPVITGASEVTFFASENRDINYLIQFYTLSDDDPNGLVSWYNLPTVTFNIPGTFNIVLQAIDLQNNIGSKNVSVIVLATQPPVDTTPPTILGNSAITVYTNEAYTSATFIEKFFVITDPSGIKSRFLSPSVSFTVAGSYVTTLFAVDGYDNIASRNLFITVVDGVNPELPIIPTDNIITKIMIGGVDFTTKIKIGVTLINKIDTELDVGTLILPITSITEPFKPFTPVYVYFRNVTEPVGYYVNDDTVVSISGQQTYFQHSINLIEPTKILERRTCTDMAFTQPLREISQLNVFTYTLKDVVDRIRKNSPLRVFGNGHFDTIESTLNTKLDTVIAPQMIFKGNTMFEALSRVFSYIGGIPRLKLKENGQLELNIDYYNQISQAVNNNFTMNITKALNSDYFVDYAKVNLENATNDYASVSYPSEGYASGRTDQDVMTSDNIFLEVPYPIYEIKDFELYLPVISGGVRTERKIDVTPYVVEKDFWDALPNMTVERQERKELHKQNTFYYIKGQNRIYNVFKQVTSSEVQYWQQFLAIFGFNNIQSMDTINIMINTIIAGTDDSFTFPLAVSYADLLFRCDYRTLLSTKIRIYKDKTEGNVGGIPLNQTENVVDLLLIGNNAKGVINRVGNTDLIVTKQAKDLNTLYKVGQYTTENYIVTSVENSFFDSYIRSTAHFTKDYNGLSKYVGVDSEYREIDLQRETVKTHLRYDEFIMVGSTDYQGIGLPFVVSGFLNTIRDYLRPLSLKSLSYSKSVTATDTGQYEFRPILNVAKNIEISTQTLQVTLGAGTGTVTGTVKIIDLEQSPLTATIFNQTFTTNQTINLTILKPGGNYIIEAITSNNERTVSAVVTVTGVNLVQFGNYAGYFKSNNFDASSNPRVLISPDISAVGNSLKIDFKMESNLSAGKRMDIDTSGALDSIQVVRYTNLQGKFSSFEFSIAKMNELADFNLESIRAKRLPFVEVNDFETPIFSSSLFNYDKDSAEKFEMTYQNHMLVSPDDDNYIVLGKELLSKMFLAKNKDDLDFVIYASDTALYTKDSNEKVKGDIVTGASYTVTVTGFYVKIVFQGELNTEKSFAIGNRNRDLIIGFNNYHPYNGTYKFNDEVYFKFISQR